MRKLNAGSPVGWLFRSVLRYSLSVGMLFLAIDLMATVLADFHVNCIGLVYAAIAILIPLASLAFGELWYMGTTEFIVEDGCFEGIDLYFVRRVRYGKHCLYVDKTRFDYVPKPRTLYNSLADYYFEITGEELP